MRLAIGCSSRGEGNRTMDFRDLMIRTMMELEKYHAREWVTARDGIPAHKIGEDSNCQACRLWVDMFGGRTSSADPSDHKPEYLPVKFVHREDILESVYGLDPPENIQGALACISDEEFAEIAGHVEVALSDIFWIALDAAIKEVDLDLPVPGLEQSAK